MAEELYSATVIYLVNQIKRGNLNYQQIIKARPDLKISIDQYIDEKGLTNIIDKQ